MGTLIIVLFIIILLLQLYWFGLKQYYQEAETAREIHTIRTQDGWLITLYRYYGENPGDPVLLCHGLSGNRFNFVYPSGNSIVDSLITAGYDCWAIELRGSRSSTPPKDRLRHEVQFEDYVCHDLPSAIKHIRELTGNEHIHWIGHSMGGMLLYSYELIHGRDALASGVTLGTPPGFQNVKHSKHPIGLAFITRLPLVADILLRLSTPLIPLLRIKNSITPINWENMSPDIKFYNLMELPPPTVLQQFTLWSHSDTWRLADGKIDVLTGLRTLTTPLLTIGGVSDSLAPPHNLETFNDTLPTDDKKLLILSRTNGQSNDYDHVDLVFSPNGLKEVYTPIIQWLDQHALFKADSESHRITLEQTQAAIELLDSPIPMKSNPKPKKTSAPLKKSKTKKSTRSGQALWGNALEDAASVLSGLSSDTQTKKKPTTKKAVKKKKKTPIKPKKKATKKKSTPSKKASATKPKTKKTSPKKKSPIKKKATAKKPNTKAKK